MERAESLSTVEELSSFTDVLYLTNQGHMPPELKRLLRLKKLSFSTLPIDKYPQIREQLDMIGTVIIETEGMEAPQKQNLPQIIELLELENIDVILLSSRVKLPITSSSLAPARTSFSMAGTTEPLSIDELWVRINVNLAHRNKSSSHAAKSEAHVEQHQRVYKNTLAEQLYITQAMVDSLAGELRLAGLVQQDFLPTQLPDTDQLRWASVFLPAEWVSGDIYDIVRIDEQHIGFYIADVVGHGMPAALLTIFLKQALVMRETIENNYRIFSPAEVMQNINVRMAAQKLSGYQFATCCYCLLNTKTLQLTYARAGHPYPILIRPGQQPKQLEIRGSLLGIFDQAEYIQQTIQLKPGDKMLLYSDGAEHFIGRFDDQKGFVFGTEFNDIKERPVVEMIDGLNNLIQNKKIEPSKVDDITIVALEILH